MNVKRCRACGGEKLNLFLDLGFTPLADRFLRVEQLDSPESYYPLKVLKCDDCSFVQLSYVVPPDILYCNDYPYESSTTSTGRTHFDAFAGSVVDAFQVSPGSLTVDIGSNVGVLLAGFAARGCRVLGFEPAANIAEIALRNGIETVNEFFNCETAENAAKTYGRAKIITGSNVFAHIDDIHMVMKGIDCLLSKDGVFIVEAPYFANLLRRLEYDTIYHEHLSYLSVTPLVPFFKSCGFELFNVEHMDIHGGSIRLYVCRAGEREVSPGVAALIEEEESTGVHSMERLIRFACDVKRNREELVGLLHGLKADGKKIVAVSAPAKGMTLLNYCRLDSSTLDFATEKSKLKIGRYTPGAHLKVLSDEVLHESGVDYALLLAWNFKDEIMMNLSKFKNGGGKFIVPIPKPVII